MKKEKETLNKIEKLKTKCKRVSEWLNKKKVEGLERKKVNERGEEREGMFFKVEKPKLIWIVKEYDRLGIIKFLLF